MHSSSHQSGEKRFVQLAIQLFHMISIRFSSSFPQTDPIRYIR